MARPDATTTCAVGLAWCRGDSQDCDGTIFHRGEQWYDETRCLGVRLTAVTDPGQPTTAAQFQVLGSEDTFLSITELLDFGRAIYLAAESTLTTPQVTND